MGKFKVGDKVAFYYHNPAKDELGRHICKIKQIGKDGKLVLFKDGYIADVYAHPKTCRRLVKKKCPGDFDGAYEKCKKCGLMLTEHPLPVTVNNIEWPRRYVAHERDIEKLSHRVDALVDGLESVRKSLERVHLTQIERELAIMKRIDNLEIKAEGN